MKLALVNKTHPEVTVLNIDIEHETVVFRNKDGVCSAPYVSVGDIPTDKELLTSVSAVLSEEKVMEQQDES
jgi:hypothetical protein